MFLIKLGGSVVTDKSQDYVFREATVKRLATELYESHADTILIHGGGSFGHPLAKRYALAQGYKSDAQIKGVAEVQRDMRRLNLKIIDGLLDAGINAVSLPPSAVVRCSRKELSAIDIDVFKSYLGLGLVPVTFGDVVLDYRQKFCICSGDALMLALAQAFKPTKTIFVMDVDGYYDADPRMSETATLIREISAEDMGHSGDSKSPHTIIDTRIGNREQSQNAVADVTGGIAGKLEVAKALAAFTEVLFVNGLVAGRLRDALMGKDVVGTVIR